MATPYETADRGTKRPPAIRKRARALMSPEDEAAARRARLEELEAQDTEDGDDMPPAA